MSEQHEMRLATKVIHSGQRPDPVTGAVMPSISVASTYAQSSPGVHQGFEYSRVQNPTRYALERMVGGLESAGLSEEEDPGCGGFAFCSGMAAIANIVELIPAGSRIVAMDDLYGGTGRLFTQVLAESRGMRTAYVDLTDPAAFERELTPETKLVWLEAPTNPLLKLVDLPAIAKIARRQAPDAILGCDSTFTSSINMRPLELGFDIAMHSSTKFMNGHSDAVGGLIATNRRDIAERLRFLQMSVGAVLPPFDSYLTLRGIKTLAIRMAKHNESSMRIAKFLDQHAKVERVLYPGLPSHPQHELAKKQLDGFGGIVTIFLKDGLEEARRLLERVRLFALAESLGGVESLVEHPAIMTHASVSPERRAELGISDSLVRFSVGIEDCDDLIADIEQALG